MKDPNDPHRYDDIIHLPHPTSTRHPRMSPQDRAAQFSPFAALTGYDAVVSEVGRLTETRIHLDDSAKEELDRKLLFLQQRLLELPQITVTYFRPDDRKAGGAYVDLTGKLKKIDSQFGCLIFQDGTLIPMEDVIRLEGALFQALEQETVPFSE